MKTMNKILIATIVTMMIGTGIALGNTNVGGATANDPNWHAVSLSHFAPGTHPMKLGGDVFKLPRLGINWINQVYTTSGDDNPDYAIEPNFGLPGPYMGAKF